MVAHRSPRVWRFSERVLAAATSPAGASTGVGFSQPGRASVKPRESERAIPCESRFSVVQQIAEHSSFGRVLIPGSPCSHPDSVGIASGKVRNDVSSWRPAEEPIGEDDTRGVRSREKSSQNATWRAWRSVVNEAQP